MKPFQHPILVGIFAFLIFGQNAQAEHGDLSNLDSQGGGGASIPSSLTDSSEGAPGTSGSIDLGGGGGALGQTPIPALSAPNSVSAEEAYNPEIAVPTMESWRAAQGGTSGGYLPPRSVRSLQLGVNQENKRIQMESDWVDSRTQ